MTTKSTRISILGWVLLPLIFAMTIAFSTTSIFLLNQVSRDVDAHLHKGASELRLLSEKAVNPRTGMNYTSAADLLSLYVARVVPESGESIFVVVDGLVTERSAGDVIGRIDLDDSLINQIKSVESPSISSFDSEYGEIRYLAMPVRGLSDSGHMVSAIFVDQREAPVLSVLYQLAALLTVAVCCAIAIGWFVSGKILRPISQLRQTAKKIRDGNFRDRIPDFKDKSELAGIAQEFNQMLDRIQGSFESQRRFIDDAGHELRTPLTIIRGHLEQLKSDPDNAETNLGIVRDEVSRMSRIVQDLQTLTKADSANFIKPGNHSVSDTLDEVFVKASGLGNRHWRLSLDSDSVRSFDRQRIVQAILQLVDNSLKHTSEHDFIEIGARKNGDRLEFFVADSGPGIPLASRKTITRRFSRGSWTPQDTDGSGLGLAIVEAICKAHSGSFALVDTKLGGIEAVLQLPLSPKDSGDS